jgi:hypothetical protein
METDFVANLMPSPSNCRAALQTFLFRWLAVPAMAAGYQRWGLKETRLSAVEACLLQWIFPEARFLVIVRDPRAAYLSCRNAGGDFWFEPRALSPILFASHWSRLALSWKEPALQLEHRLVRYEDLATEQVDFDQLGAFLQLDLRPARALESRAGSIVGGARSLSLKEENTIETIASEAMRAFGYPTP